MVHKVKFQPDEKTLQREKIAFDLRTKGWTQTRIADHLGISQVSVSKILTRVNKKYTRLFMNRVANVKAEQVAIHNQIVEESLDAWHKSKCIHRVTKTRAKGRIDKKGKQKTIGGDKSEEEKQLFGDTRYLDTSMKAMEHIRKIVGVGTEDDTAERDPIFGKVELEIIDKRTLEIENECKEHKHTEV